MATKKTAAAAKAPKDMAALLEEFITVTVDGGGKRPTLREPATAAQIASLEKAWKRPLPPDYRAFLEITNGLPEGDGFTHRLLGTEDQKWADEQIDMFAEFWDEDEFDRETVLPLAVPDGGDGIGNMAAFERGKGTEMAIIDWDEGSELQRFKTFAAYLTDQIKVLRSIAKDKAKAKK